MTVSYTARSACQRYVQPTLQFVASYVEISGFRCAITRVVGQGCTNFPKIKV